jgi:predicted DCC family thiol-disulfide oxidoreductase YuxK
MLKLNKKATIVLLSALIAIVASWILYQAFAPRIIEAVYRGESLPFLNERLVGRSKYDLPYYLDRGQKYFNIFLALEMVAGLLLVGSMLPSRLLQRLWQGLIAFINVATHPINLAVFRFVFFLTMFILAIDWASGPIDTSNALFWGQFPRELLFPPPGLGWLAPYLPISVTLMSITSKLMLLFSFTATIGLYSRTSAWLTTLMAFYVMGVPNFFGSMNHYHHLIWFGVLLALSPCGDMLSVDSIFSAWRRADRGEVTPPGPALSYGVPIRFVWLLIGILYFFPGFWKFWESGFRWAFSDNLKNHLYTKWFVLGDWQPLIHVDQYPIVYQSLAFLTLFFEISFVFFIFVPWLRLLDIVLGQSFHFGTYFLMRIPFFDVQACYAAFFNWDRIFLYIGGWLFKDVLFLIYDGNCQLCRRTIASLRMFDVLGRVQYINAHESEQITASDFKWLDHQAMMTDMHATIGRKKWLGYAAYQALAWRIPLLWPLIPFLGLDVVARWGESFYRRTADSRTCKVVRVQATSGQRTTINVTPSLRLVTVVGVVLVVVNTLLGFANIHSWPFSSYPTFQVIRKPEVQSIALQLETANNQTVIIDNQQISKYFSDDRFFPLVFNIFREADASGNTERQQQRLTALWHLIQVADPALQSLQVTKVGFYKNTYTVLPERLHENPLGHELLGEVAAR